MSIEDNHVADSDDHRTNQSPGNANAASAHGTPPGSRRWSWLGAVAGGLLITTVAGFEIGGCPPALAQAAASMRAEPLHTMAAVVLFPVTTVTTVIPDIERNAAQRLYHAIEPGTAHHARPSQGHSSHGSS